MTSGFSSKASATATASGAGMPRDGDQIAGKAIAISLAYLAACNSPACTGSVGDQIVITTPDRREEIALKTLRARTTGSFQDTAAAA